MISQKSGKSLSLSTPVIDANLPDGSRLQASLGREVTTNGSSFTIRKFRSVPFSPVDLISIGSTSPRIFAYLWILSEYGSNIIIVGGTASGKTTFLNSILLFIPPEKKIITIEDTKELNLFHENWVSTVPGRDTEFRDRMGRWKVR
jgi:Type IV secretory pathway, VirB11 components, and related ATPases involved in archaeal flagella biosynthesis